MIIAHASMRCAYMHTNNLTNMQVHTREDARSYRLLESKRQCTTCTGRNLHMHGSPAAGHQMHGTGVDMGEK